VVASLPLADDMREALVLRRGSKGQLLDCVTSLESGEDEKASEVIAGAAELYLESLIWANGAAESLFGAAEGAPVHTNGSPPHTNGHRNGRASLQYPNSPSPVSTPPPEGRNWSAPR